MQSRVAVFFRVVALNPPCKVTPGFVNSPRLRKLKMNALSVLEGTSKYSQNALKAFSNIVARKQSQGSKKSAQKRTTTNEEANPRQNARRRLSRKSKRDKYKLKTNVSSRRSVSRSSFRTRVTSRERATMRKVLKVR